MMKKQKVKDYLLNIYNNLSLDLNINYTCSLSCKGCNRLLDYRKYPDRNLSIKKVQNCINDSIYSKIHWKRINISGGEPTLHTDILEIVNILVQYRSFFSPKTHIQIVTNGFNNHTRNIIKQVENKILVVNSKKTKSKKDIKGFDPHFICPKEIGRMANRSLLCCEKPYECGFCLDYQGYFICHFGATICMNFPDVRPRARITDLTPKNVLEDIKNFCCYCGHVCNQDLPNGVLSNSWKKRIKLLS